MKRILPLLFSLLLLSTAPAVAEECGAYRYELTGNGAEITAYEGEEVQVLEIPATLDGYPVKSIGDYALAYHSMESVILPDGLNTIGACAFNACYHLQEIHFPQSLQVIGADAFLCCQSLTELNLPPNITRIEDEAFYNCLNLRKVRLCADTVLGERVFESCFSLTQIERYLR